MREGYDPVYGARPLKRAIQRRIENPLARLIVSGSLTEGARILAEAAPGGGEPVFRLRRRPAEDRRRRLNGDHRPGAYCGMRRVCPGWMRSRLRMPFALWSWLVVTPNFLAMTHKESPRRTR